MFVSIAPRLRGFFACRKPLRFPGKDIVARIAYDDPLTRQGKYRTSGSGNQMTKIEQLEQLVAKYQNDLAYYHSRKYNETQLRTDFLDPLFTLLGWDIINAQGKPTNEREVLVEEGLKARMGETRRNRITPSVCSLSANSLSKPKSRAWILPSTRNRQNRCDATALPAN
jgi:hypothetical protein